MNYKKFAGELEQLLNEEFQKNLPIARFSKKLFIYNKFKIEKNINDSWDLKHINDDIIHTFQLCSTALLAAKYYNSKKYKALDKIKILDASYWHNSLDSILYKKYYKSSKDEPSKNIYYARFLTSSDKASYYKSEIFKYFQLEIAKYNY